MLTKRWYKLWNLRKISVGKKGKEKLLYTGQKKIQSSQRVPMCWFGVLFENVYFTWNICALLILTLAIHPNGIPLTHLNCGPTEKVNFYLGCFQREVYVHACMCEVVLFEVLMESGICSVQNQWHCSITRCEWFDLDSSWLHGCGWLWVGSHFYIWNKIHWKSSCPIV